jgi:DNA-binding transcriptional MerR regulator
VDETRREGGVRLWRVGELARRAGLTVRTLHHWDALGLLRPSRRSRVRAGAGYRLYAAADVERLQRILSLRRLGLSLDEIKRCLGREEFSLLAVLRLHARALREQIERQQRLCSRLEAIAARLESAETVSAEELVEVMEEIVMFEKYYTPEQLAQLAARGRELGAERIAAVEAEWPRLIAAVRAEMEKGTDPASAGMRELARRWRELVEMFTGGDPGIARSLERLYRDEPAARERTGLDPGLADYVGRAMRSLPGNAE